MSIEIGNFLNEQQQSLKNENKVLSDTWLKASVLGATWAASEIILGSFLHNLHVPFKGNVLTAIGLILLITASYKWKNKGLFWRSGLICALMKTISPSAFIFGPMIAIFAEALLFEISVRLLGRNTAGFMVGAVLAMSWILVQKILNLLLIYSFNLVTIYDNLLVYIEKQLDVQSDIFWLPMFVLLAVYAGFGLITVIVGVRIGRKILQEPKQSQFKTSIVADEQEKRVKTEFPHSIAWLAVSFIALVFSLFIISRSAWYVWLPWSVVLLSVWLLRYKRGMRQLAKVKFWLSFIVLTVLAAILISSVNGSQNNWIDGFWMGFEMNVRAAIVVVGFSVLGTELYNPVIRNFLSRSAYRQAGMALELAFDSLPYVIGHLPDAKTFLTQPARVVRLLIHHAEFRFDQLNKKQPARVFIVSGGVADGKTTFLSELLEGLKKQKCKLAGFISPRILEGGKTIGYDLENVATHEHFAFLRKNGTPNGDMSDVIGRYKIDLAAQQRAKQILLDALVNSSPTVVIDEVGRLELNGKGWHDEIKRLAQKDDIYLLLSVRDVFVDEVIEKFGLYNAQICEVKSTSCETLKDQLCPGEN